jgi:putative peptidoglycan lipid II flippase
MTASSPKLEISQKLSVGRASLLMAAMIGLSRLTGFARMMLVSHLYATGSQAAVFEAAFNIPDTITILIAGGALATGFVPVFTSLIARGEHEAARRTFRAMWTLLGTAFGLITVVLLALTWTPWAPLLAPQKIDAASLELYFQLLRILLVAQLFFVVGGLFSGTLNALRLFIYPALQPVMFNCGIILFGILLPLLFHMGIESQAWGALAGAVVGSLLIQLPAVRRHGLSLAPLWDIHDEGVRRVLRSLLPIVFGLASGQIIALNLPRFIAYAAPLQLPPIGYANRLMQVPLDLLASGPAIALFPTLSLLWAENKTAELRTTLASALRRTLVLTCAATALLAALRVPIVHFLLEHGEFSFSDTLRVAPVLGCYSLCIVGLGAQQVLARGFYAIGDVKPPIFVGLGAMALFAVLAKVIPLFVAGAGGLALAAAGAVSVLGLALWLALRRKLGGWDGGATETVLLKSVAAGVVAYWAALFLAQSALQGAARFGLDSETASAMVKYGTRCAICAIAAGGGAAAFVIVGAALHIGELGFITNKLKRRSAVEIDRTS